MCRAKSFSKRTVKLMVIIHRCAVREAFLRPLLTLEVLGGYVKTQPPYLLMLRGRIAPVIISSCIEIFPRLSNSLPDMRNARLDPRA